jgi:diguanylate cyclase (GGDEF)-like protein
MGVVVAEHGRRVGARIERRVVSTAERFAAHGALALANAWLLERIRRMASTDGLTGVANRRSLEQAIEAELARAARAGEDVSLVMIDVDHFKRLNDTYGHQTGDEVLRRVAAELQAGVRSFDTVGRYGGEEFAVVLPRSGAAEAAQIAERLRVGIEQSGTEPGVTVSAGVATFPLDAVAADALFGAADGALYASKAAGRNRVTAASRPSLVAPRA